MGQVKPMVKMMTTEPTVELKLKKGGSVKMQAGGLSGWVLQPPKPRRCLLVAAWMRLVLRCVLRWQLVVVR